MKAVVFLGDSLDVIRAFPEQVRRQTGFELRQVQHGLDPSDWKPMPSVGAGVVEIRIQTRLQHRVLYVAKFREAVYVLHSFAKKTRKTRASDLSTARSRLKELEARRRIGKEE